MSEQPAPQTQIANTTTPTTSSSSTSKPWLTSPAPSPIIKTPTSHSRHGFSIRAYTLADAPQLAAAADSPAIAHRMGDRFPSPYTLSDAEEFITKFGRPDPKNGMPDHNFGIFMSMSTATSSPSSSTPAANSDGNDQEQQQQQLIGGIGLMPLSREHRYSAEIGYWLTPKVWGKGLATAIVGEFVKWSFRQFPQLVRIQARHHAGNERSGRVLLKNGFQVEGCLRRAWACRDDGRGGGIDAAGANDSSSSPSSTTTTTAAVVVGGDSGKDGAGAPRYYVLDLYIYGLLRDP